MQIPRDLNEVAFQQMPMLVGALKTILAEAVAERGYDRRVVSRSMLMAGFFVLAEAEGEDAANDFLATMIEADTDDDPLAEVPSGGRPN